MRFTGRFCCTLLVVIPALANAQVEPGMWEASITVQSMDMPGAPPQIAAMMRGKTTRQTYCITPEQAANGPQEMMKQKPSCRFTKYVMARGTLSAEMSCRQAGGMMNARANGSYSPTTFNVTSSATMTGQMTLRVTSTSTGRRIGSCAGK